MKRWSACEFSDMLLRWILVAAHAIHQRALRVSPVMNM